MRVNYAIRTYFSVTVAIYGQTGSRYERKNCSNAWIHKSGIYFRGGVLLDKITISVLRDGSSTPAIDEITATEAAHTIIAKELDGKSSAKFDKSDDDAAKHVLTNHINDHHAAIDADIVRQDSDGNDVITKSDYTSVSNGIQTAEAASDRPAADSCISMNTIGAAQSATTTVTCGISDALAECGSVLFTDPEEKVFYHSAIAADNIAAGRDNSTSICTGDEANFLVKRNPFLFSCDQFDSFQSMQDSTTTESTIANKSAEMTGEMRIVFDGDGIAGVNALDQIMKKIAA